MNKPKFNKNKCVKCKYHTRSSVGHPVRVGNNSVRICCNFASITGCTSLKPGPYNSVTDLRGDDYDNCKLFSPGVPENVR